MAIVQIVQIGQFPREGGRMMLPAGNGIWLKTVYIGHKGIYTASRATRRNKAVPDIPRHKGISILHWAI